MISWMVRHKAGQKERRPARLRLQTMSVEILTFGVEVGGAWRRVWGWRTRGSGRPGPSDHHYLGVNFYPEVAFK